MSNDSASVYIDCHNQANQSFFSLEKEFLAVAEKVDRNSEEFHFQQLKKDYVNELKRRLDMSAQEVMRRKGLINTTCHEFNDLIREYLYRFVQKINAY